MSTVRRNDAETGQCLSRKAFLQDAGRLVLGGGLLLAGALLGFTGRDTKTASCPPGAVCSGCREFSSCRKPAARQPDREELPEQNEGERHQR